MSQHDEERERARQAKAVKDAIDNFNPIAHAAIMNALAREHIIAFKAYCDAGFTEDQAIKMIKRQESA